MATTNPMCIDIASILQEKKTWRFFGDASRWQNAIAPCRHDLYNSHRHCVPVQYLPAGFFQIAMNDGPTC
eukprot:scaffold421_cov99-Amphora_coffeaeformis.AAC.1